MCVIVVKPKGKKFPKKEMLQKAWKRNSDGAGFMYPDNGRVIIKKGFMTFKDFYDNLKVAKNKVGNKAPFVMHFRITTHGGTSAENTHPFPISHKLENTKLTNLNCGMGVAHNGVIRLPETTGVDNYSDSQLYITKYLPILITSKNFYENKLRLDLIEKSIGNTDNYCYNRLAIMDGNGTITKIGEFQELDGIFYSNLHHRYVNLNPPKPVVTKAPTKTNWLSPPVTKEKKEDEYEGFACAITNLDLGDFVTINANVYGYVNQHKQFVRWSENDKYLETYLEAYYDKVWDGLYQEAEQAKRTD